MSDHVDPPAGELVVQNGKLRGLSVPLAGPVTVIGSGPQVDARLSGPGVGDLHCLIAITSAGPVLRSWFPDDTILNGHPTTHAILTDGDDLRVGPCVFRVHWERHLVPLAAAELQAVPVVEAEIDDIEWALQLREQAVSAQEAELTALFDDRTRHLEGLLTDVAAKREALRLKKLTEAKAAKADRATIREMKAQTDRIRRANRAERMRTKKVYVRFIARLKAKWTAERRAVGEERATVNAERRTFDAEVARFQRDATRIEAETVERERRLRDGWELLTDGQRRLLADRQEAEATLARERATVSAWATALEGREATVDRGRAEAQAHVDALHAEIAKLELRAAQARVIVQNLEDQRAGMEAQQFSPTAALAMPDRVALAIDQHRSAEELLVELALREREVHRDRTGIAAARLDLERRAAELYDQRLVVAEQVAEIAIARHAWQQAETRTVTELEALAQAVVTREKLCDQRTLELAEADRVRRKREAELAAVRDRLEGWQAALAASESAAAAAHESAVADLADHRERLAKWEAALSTLCRKWANVRRQEVWQLRSEIDAWTDARARYRLGLAEIDDLRTQLLADAARLGSQALAWEQTQQELAGTTKSPTAARRLRVLTRRWEHHFTRAAQHVEARRAALAAEAAVADDKTATWAQIATDIADRRVNLTRDEMAAATDRLVRARDLDDQAAIYSFAEARADRLEQELATARAAVDRSAATALGLAPPEAPDDEPVLLRLPPRAA